MADKQISDLTAATTITDNTLFVAEQGGSSVKAPWSLLKNYISPGIADTYSNAATYSVGDYAIYNGSLYRCVVPITTAEAWTAAHWTAAVLGDDVGDLKGALSYLDVDTTWITGRYFNSWGAIIEYAPFSISDYIPIEVDGIRSDVYFTVYGNTATYCVFYDANKTQLSVVQIGSGEFIVAQNLHSKAFAYIYKNPTDFSRSDYTNRFSVQIKSRKAV